MDIDIEHGKKIAEAATGGGWIEDNELVDTEGDIAILGGLGQGYRIDEDDRRVIAAVSYPWLCEDEERRPQLEDEANIEHITYHDPDMVLAMYAEIERLRKQVGAAVEFTGLEPNEWL